MVKRLPETLRPSKRSGSPAPVRLKLFCANAAMPSKTVFCSRQSRKFAGDGVLYGKPICVASSHTVINASGFL
jgi:hypothetical protein